MEGKIVTYAACNQGSTALVTDKGELYMFGKDAIHCEAGTGKIYAQFVSSSFSFRSTWLVKRETKLESSYKASFRFRVRFEERTSSTSSVG